MDALSEESLVSTSSGPGLNGDSSYVMHRLTDDSLPLSLPSTWWIMSNGVEFKTSTRDAFVYTFVGSNTAPGKDSLNLPTVSWITVLRTGSTGRIELLCSSVENDANLAPISSHTS